MILPCDEVLIATKGHPWPNLRTTRNDDRLRRPVEHLSVLGEAHRIDVGIAGTRPLVLPHDEIVGTVVGDGSKAFGIGAEAEWSRRANRLGGWRDERRVDPP